MYTQVLRHKYPILDRMEHSLYINNGIDWSLLSFNSNQKRVLSFPEFKSKLSLNKQLEKNVNNKLITERNTEERKYQLYTI